MERSGPISVYCSGGIKKGAHDESKVIFGSFEREAIAKALSPVSVVFLRPDDRGDDIGDAFTVFGRDHFQVKLADFCVVDARHRRGIGVGIEMLSAKRFDKPLVSVAPPESHYRRTRLAYLGSEVEDYVHAHLFALSDAIVDSFHGAGEWIAGYLSAPTVVKGLSVLDKGIAAYEERQLGHDSPMQHILSLLAPQQGPSRRSAT